MNEQTGLWDEDGQARWSDPPTSHTAAHAVRPGSARFRLLLAHYEHPIGLTDEQACDFAALDPRSEYATRCSELKAVGYLIDTEHTRPGRTGLSRMVRRITPAGRAAVEETE